MITMPLNEREQGILKLAKGLLISLHKKSNLDEARVDAEFLFRFEVTWCRWMNRIRGMMRTMIGQTGEGPLSSKDGARWRVHLSSNVGLDVKIIIHSGKSEPQYIIKNSRGACSILDRDLIEHSEGVYSILDQDLRREVHHILTQDLREAVERSDQHRAEFERVWRQMWAEANQTSKIQSELERLARYYNLVPPDHELGEYAPNQIKLQENRVVNWVIYGNFVPLFLWQMTKLVESKVEDEDRQTIRPWKWRNDESTSDSRLALTTRIRTWAVYYLSRRGGGNLAEPAAVELWNTKFPSSKVELEQFQDECSKLFSLGTGKDLAPSLSELFDSIGKRCAVLVGVNEYEDPTYGQLQVCVKDTEAIHKLLISAEFDPDYTYLIIDNGDERPTRAHILDTLQRIANDTEYNDLLLFYYSGHGEEDSGESYLVARDGRQSVLKDTAVSVTRVKEIMKGAQARAKVVILDACHSGANIDGKGAKPMSEAFIRRVFEEAEGFFILASCKQGERSYEWRARERSVFTHFLLEALEGKADQEQKGFVTVRDVNRYVVDRVKRWAFQNRVSQTPTNESCMVGEIPLVRYLLLKGAQ